jgi:hypothetical protein
MPEFGFVGPEYVAASPTQDCQSLVNWFPEVDPNKKDDNPETPDDRGVMALYPTPGLSSLLELSAGEWRCLYTLPGGDTFLGVKSNKLYSIDSSYNETEVGTLNTYAGIVGITDNGSSAYLVDGANRYYYTWATNTFAAVIDGAFDGGTSTDIIDNFIIYNYPDTNQWGCTDAGDVVSNALNLGSMVGSSGNIVALIADHRQVLVLGETYSERHTNVGTSPWPFAVLAGSSIQHGCAAPYSVARLGEAVAFLALDKRGQSTVIMWGAALATPQRISTFAVENAIQGYAVTSDAIGYTYSQAGHEFYMLTFPTADVTWCYDIASGYWHKRAWRDPMNVYHRHRSNCCTVFGSDIVVGDWENGKLYALSQSDYTDDGEPLPCVRRCRHLTSDLKRQFFSDLQIQFQPGVGLQSGQGSDPECIMRFSRDGGFTWGNDHFVKLGKVGQYTRRAMKRRLGYARDMVVEVTITDPVYRVVVSANMNATPGAN